MPRVEAAEASVFMEYLRSVGFVGDRPHVRPEPESEPEPALKPSP